MRVHDFLQHVLELARQQLPPHLRTFKHRRRFALAQLSYSDPRIHYEVWVQGRQERIEVGLHFEAAQDTNLQLLDYFHSRFIEVMAELGPQVELERWTRSWARIHETMSYRSLDQETAGMVAERLARMIVVLQPMLEEALLSSGEGGTPSSEGVSPSPEACFSASGEGAGG